MTGNACRRPVAAALFSVWAILAGAGHGAAAELLRNGSFAETTATNVPAHWSVDTWQTRAVVTVRIHAPSNGVLRIQSPTAEDACELRQTLRDLKLARGSVLRLSGMYRTGDFAWGDGPQFFASVQFRFKVNPGVTPSIYIPLQPAAEWTSFEQRIGVDRDLQVSELVTTIAFIRCRGALLLKDLSLQEMDATEDLTLFSLKKSPPTLDGTLDDPCWQGAQVALGFMPLGRVEAAAADTEVMSVYDDETLYLAVKLHEPEVGRLRVSTKSVFAGDCVEIFLDPENRGRSYFHIAVDSRGAVYSGLNEGLENERDLDLKAKAGRHDGYWAVELAIPFAALNTALPEDNRRWGFNVGRERYAAPPAEFSSWAALAAFSQRDRFGKLAFYSRHEVEADITYWDKSDRDPLLMRTRVSGYEIAQARGGVERTPTLWTFDPNGADRTKKAWKGQAPLDPRASQRLGEEKYPQFYCASQGINRVLIAKAAANDRLAQLRRQIFHVNAWRPGQTPAESLSGMAELENESAAIEDEMNAIYMTYGAAWDADWDKSMLQGMDARIAGLVERIKAFDGAIASAADAGGRLLSEKVAWESVDLTLPANDRRLNADGATRRFTFSAWTSTPGWQEPYSLLTEFDAQVLHWPATIPRQPAPGVYAFEHIDQVLSNPSNPAPKAIILAVFGIHTYYMPLSPALAAKIPSDPDILLRSRDGLSGNELTQWGRGRNLYQGGNPNNPEVQAYIADHLKSLAAHVAPSNRIDFFLTAWESGVKFYGANTNGASVPRSVGYNASGTQAFRKYLAERYADIAALNRKWHADYRDFAAIEPPDDKYINPVTKTSGLGFEFERWQRLNWTRYISSLRMNLKSGAPQIPVMTDLSLSLSGMNLYFMFKENAADIHSIHQNPSYEEAIWTYCSAMRRKFRKELGYFENYFPMYTAGHMDNERLAQRDIRRFFFDLLMQDIRHSTWWLGYYLSHPTQYILAYGGGFFGLDYDQTIVRWSMTELAPMFARCRNIERALLESELAVPKTAIVQPCTSLFTLSLLGKADYGSATGAEMFRAHYQLLLPGNYPHDYLPEEMVLDGKGSLDEYTTLILPYAPYMTEAFSRKLMQWVERGGHLIAFGPFALKDEAGFDLPEEQSLFRRLFPGIRVSGPDDWGTSDDGSQDLPGMETRTFGEGSVAYLNRSSERILRDPALKARLSEHLAARGERLAVTPSADLKILVREGRGGERYLCLRNNLVEAPLETTVSVQGVYAQALDVVIPGWCPVALTVADGRTRLRIRLDPGDFTLVLLKPADGN